MGFSVKVAPGVRVRASSRGVRTSIGPRAARVHVGSGRTGFSTGAGPVSYYTSVGGSSRSRPRGSGAATREFRSATASPSPAAAAKAAEGRRLAAALDAVANLHRESFPDAQPPRASETQPVDRVAIAQRHAAEAKRSTSVFARTARREALAVAAANAEAEIAELTAAALAERDAYQADLDRWWADLCANDPGTVIGALAAAFEDNEAAAAPIGSQTDTVSIVVLLPDLDAVPERRPTVTAAGNVSLKKLTKSETNAFYAEMVAGHMIVTVKEAFAVAPGIRTAHVVGLRIGRTDAYGRPVVEVLAAAELSRQSLEGVRWATASALTVLTDTSVDLLMDLKGRTSELAPLYLGTRPDLQAVIDAVDVAELAG